MPQWTISTTDKSDSTCEPDKEVKFGCDKVLLLPVGESDLAEAELLVYLKVAHFVDLEKVDMSSQAQGIRNR